MGAARRRRRRRISKKYRYCSDKVVKGYPTANFLEIEIRERDNGNHFTTLIDFI